MTEGRIEAVLVGGGQGRRMGRSRPKAFLPLHGVPMWLASLRALHAARTGITRWIVVVPAGFEDETEIACRREGIAEAAFRVITGGVHRQDSVLLGLHAVRDDAEIVLVHDAARPLVPRDVVERVVAAARRTGAAVPGLPVADTVKRIDDAHHVLGTLDRRGLVTVQTPQGFRLEIIRAAYTAAAGGISGVTDDAGLVEAQGNRVVVVPGDPSNIKVTTPADMRIAEKLLLIRK